MAFFASMPAFDARSFAFEKLAYLGSTPKSAGFFSKTLLFGTVLSSLLHGSNAYAPEQARKVALAIRDDSPNQSSDVATVAFASAVSIEAAMVNQQATLASVQAVPLPSATDEADKLEQAPMSTLAGLLPPIQTSLGGRSDDFDMMLAQLAPDPAAEDGETSSTSKLKTRQGSMNIMVVGDSISHGQEGDWTWRYRIWQWLRSQNVAFQFVGPYKGTQEPTTKNPGPPQAPPLYGQNASSNNVVRSAGGYNVGCDSGFTSNSQHFSVWGRAAATDLYLIADMVKQYPTDVMLLMLGFNDLGWFYSDSSGTIKSIATMIKNARSVNPNMKFAIANVVQRTDIGRRDLIQNTDLYNSYLKQEIPKWNTTQSPVVLVDVQSRYTCGPNGSCTAAYDGLHPNSLGEYQIASAFADGLINLKIGKSALSVPSNPPQRSTPVPSNFKVSSSPQGVTATWDAVYGAYGYDVQTRIQGQDWTNGAVIVNRFDLQWTVPNTTYEVRVRTSCGDIIKGDWTSAGTGDASNAMTVAPPETFTVHSTSDGFTASWNTPTGRGSNTIVEYNLLYFDVTDNCGFLIGAAFKSSPATVTGLVPGHKYLVGIEVWNQAGEGLPKVGFNILVGGNHAPAAPSNLQIQAMDGGSAYFTWDPVSDAAAYRIWKQYQNNAPVQYNGSVDATCSTDYFLFPGVQNYKYCLNSVNGNDEGPRGPCVQAPQPNGDKKLSCPAAPGYCPGGGGKFGPPPESPGNAPDYDAGQSGSNGGSPTSSGNAGASSTDIFLDTVIYKGTPTASCVPPCNFIFPPYPYSTVLTPPAWTTSLQYAYPTATTVTGGSTRTLYLTTVLTTTISLAPITKTALDAWNFNYTKTQSTVYALTGSYVLPPITIGKPNPPPGVTTIPHITKSRTITPPLFESSGTANRPQITILPITVGGDGGGGGGGGAGGPKCPSSCGGFKCLIRCSIDLICFNPFGCPGLDGSDGGNGFADPEGGPPPDEKCTTTRTVTDTTYYVSYQTNSQGSTTSTTTYSTASSPHSGCTVTPTTITSTTVGGCSSGCCQTYVYDDGTYPDAEETDSSSGASAKRARFVPRRPLMSNVDMPEITQAPDFAQNLVERGAANSYRSFADCPMQSGQAIKPAYPAVAQYSDYPGASKWFVVTQPPPRIGQDGKQTCLPQTFVKLPNLDVSKSPGGPTYTTLQPKKPADPAKPTPWVNSDHVYELSNMGYFFGDVIKEASDRAGYCRDFQNYIAGTRLNDVLKQLPSNDNADFAGMDNLVNAMKGVLMNKDGGGFKFTPAKAGTEDQTYNVKLTNFGMAAKAINNDDFVKLFQKTHQRMYVAFQNLDKTINAGHDNCKEENIPPASIKPDWASRYSSWMATFISTQGMSASAVASSYYDAWGRVEGAKTAEVKATYPPEAFLFRSADMTPLSLARRGFTEMPKRQACSSTATPTSTSSEAPVRTVFPDYARLNVYSDTNCQNVVENVYGQDIDNKCHDFPTEIRSYQFTHKDYSCNSNGKSRAAVNIYLNKGCEQSPLVGAGCGQDLSCQQTQDGTGKSIEYFQTGTNKRSLTTFGNFTIYN